MKRTSGIICVAASAFLMSIAGAMASYTHEDQSFAGSQGDLPGNGLTSWTCGTSYFTNTTPGVVGSALAIPGLATVSNSVGEATEKVWTDFWTAPTKYTNGIVTAPDIDTTATVQFFVDQAGNWVTFSGNGHGGYQTNVLETVLSGTGTDLDYPRVTDNPSFYRVSILSDYAASPKQYSFFVNEKCLGTNLLFMCDPAPGSARWFQVQNLAKSSDEVCLLDEYLLTNRLSGVLTTPITGGGMSQGDAVYYFGTVEPKPVTTNVGLAAILGPDAFRMEFKPQPNQKYILVGGQSPLGAMSGVSTVLVDNAGTSNYLADANALADSRNNYFYRILTVSTLDNSVTLTNNETYAWFKQSRSVSNSWYWSGVPVSYLSGGNTLAGEAGRQLAQGLIGGINEENSDLLILGNSTCFLNLGNQWADVGGGDLPTTAISPGMGVMIRRRAGTPSPNRAVLSGTWTNTITQVALEQGWNSLIWPYAVSASADNNGFPNTTGDKYSVQRNGAPKQFRKIAAKWVNYPSGADVVTADWPQPGEGFLYYSSAAGKNWVPVQ